MEYERDNKDIFIKVREIIYLICLGLFGIKKIFFGETLWKVAYPFLVEYETTITDIYENKLIYLLWFCIVLAFFTTKPKLLHILLAIFLVIAGKKASLIQGDVYIYLEMLFIVAAVGLSAKKLLVFWMSFNIPILVVTVIASKLNVVENIIEIGRNREFLGFVWTTTPVMIFAYAVFEYIILRKGELRMPELVCICSLNVWLFLRTNTRFAFLIVFLVIGVFAVYKFSKEIRGFLRQIRHWLVALPWLFFSITYISAVIYDQNDSVMSKFNHLLSNRLKQCNYSLQIYPLKPWGQFIEFVQTRFATADNPATYVDTAYLQILLRFGYCIITGYLILSSILIYRAFKERRVYIALVFITILVFGLFEQQLYWLQFDIILLLSFASWKSLPIANAEKEYAGER